MSGDLASSARSHRLARAGMGVLAMALAAPSIGLGFVMDDRSLRGALHSLSSHAPAAWDLFRFVPGDAEFNARAIKNGFLPWWSSPDLRIHFFRPLSSLLFALDDRLFDAAPLGYHLVSLAWYAALLFGVTRLFSKVLAPLPATLAFGAFALASAQVEPVVWISARHVLVAATLGTAALLARSARFRRWLAPTLFVLALAGSEAALGIVPLWIALVMIEEDRTQRERVRELAPVVGIALAYLAAYGLLEYGARASGSYHDPLVDPLAFATTTLTRIPILLGQAALGIPITLSYFISPVAMALVGVAAMGFVALAWRSVGRPAIGWFVAAGLAGAALGATGFPTGRMLVIPNLAFAMALGVIAARWSQSGPGGRGAIAVLALGHVAIEPSLALRGVLRFGSEARATEAVAREELALAPPSGRLVIVAASDPLVFLFSPSIAAELSPHTLRFPPVLSAAHSGHRLTRVSERGFTLVATDRPLLAGSFDALFRSPDEPFAVGQKVVQCDLTIEVLAVEGGLPTKLEVDAPVTLDDASWRFTVWRDGHLEALRLPTIGATIELPWSPGPTGVL